MYCITTSALVLEEHAVQHINNFYWLHVLGFGSLLPKRILPSFETTNRYNGWREADENWTQKYCVKNGEEELIQCVVVVEDLFLN